MNPISQEQSRIFARAIYNDISAYIAEHQEEYRKYQVECESEEAYEIEGTY